jgi:hypothetical protein
MKYLLIILIVLALIGCSGCWAPSTQPETKVKTEIGSVYEIEHNGKVHVIWLYRGSTGATSLLLDTKTKE